MSKLAVIEEENGVVDKFVGDAIMAVWGLPLGEPEESATRAVRACLKMRERLAVLNIKREERGQKPIKIGMGLNSGEVVAGNIGSQSRMEYTVIGDTVNTAARMESQTKEQGTDFLIHETTAHLLGDGFILEGPFEIRAKGKSEVLRVYGVKAENKTTSEGLKQVA